MLGRRRDVDTKGRAGERLAIGAVADVERIGIDLGLEGDLAAVAASVDFHASSPVIIRGRRDDRLNQPQARIRAALTVRIIVSVSYGVSASCWRMQGEGVTRAGYASEHRHPHVTSGRARRSTIEGRVSRPLDLPRV